MKKNAKHINAPSNLEELFIAYILFHSISAAFSKLMKEQKFENEMPDWISAEVEIQFIQGGSWQQLIFQLLRESISVKEKN